SCDFSRLAMSAVELRKCRIQLSVYPVKLGRHFGEMPLCLARSFVEQTQVLGRDAGEIGVDRAAHLLRDLGPVRLCFRLEALLLVPFEIDLRQLQRCHGSRRIDMYQLYIIRRQLGSRPSPGRRRRTASSLNVLGTIELSELAVQCAERQMP